MAATCFVRATETAWFTSIGTSTLWLNPTAAQKRHSFPYAVACPRTTVDRYPRLSY